MRNIAPMKSTITVRIPEHSMKRAASRMRGTPIKAWVCRIIGARLAPGIVTYSATYIRSPGAWNLRIETGYMPPEQAEAVAVLLKRAFVQFAEGPKPMNMQTSLNFEDETQH